MSKTRRARAARWRLAIQASTRPRRWRLHVNHTLVNTYWNEHHGQRVYIIDNADGVRTEWMETSYVRLLSMRPAPELKRRRRKCQ